MPAVGIDLGTTNSLAVAFMNGKSILISNAYGEFLTPSMAYSCSCRQKQAL